ncbi:MAG: ORF6N domain-containing protein, partial [Bacteroidales bacterium]|nr:ORF6N domain-containing protein [Bacteroidales bacterium]
EINNLIYLLRGQYVLLDRDLAELYHVETKILNQTVKRNLERFPEDFMFRLNYQDILSLRRQVSAKKIQNIENDEFIDLRSQIVTSSLQDSENQNTTKNTPLVIQDWGGSRYHPYAFTENGVAMLSGVLKSPQAIKINIMIMRAFVVMRKKATLHSHLFNRIENIESFQLATQKRLESHEKQIEQLESVFKVFDNTSPIPQQGIFYNGQIFDSYIFFCERIREAKENIILIDNYIDESILAMLDKRAPHVHAKIYTKQISNQLKVDLQKHNAQYAFIEVYTISNVHDRFLIIDESVYLIGASLKDLGKKIFGFTKMESLSPGELLTKLK